MSSYSNRIAAYNAKVRVFGNESTSSETQDTTDDSNYVTFAFYENIEDAAKDTYPGGLSFGHDKTSGTGAIFKEGQIVSSKVLDITYTEEPLVQEITGSQTAKAGQVAVKFVALDGTVQTLTFQTVNQSLVKEMISVMSGTSEELDAIDAFLKKTDNIDAICEHVNRIVDVSTIATPEGFVQYKINFKYEELYTEIVRDLKADDYISLNREQQTERDAQQDALIAANLERIALLDGELAQTNHNIELLEGNIGRDINALREKDTETEIKLSEVFAGYINDAKVMISIPENGEAEPMRDTVVLSKRDNESGMMIEFDIPSDGLYNRLDEIETAGEINADELVRVNQRVDALVSEDGSIWRELTGLHSQIDEVSDKVDNDIASTVESLGQHIDSSLAELRAWTEETVSEAGSTQTTALDEFKESVTAELEALQTSIVALQEKDVEIIQSIGDNVAALEGDIQTVETALETAKSELNSQIELLDSSVEARINDVVEDVNGQFETLIDAVDAKFDKSAQDLAALQTEFNELSVETSTFIGEATSSLDEIKKLSDELTEVVTGINEKFDSSISEIWNKMGEIEEQIETLNENYSERFLGLDGTISTLRNDFEAFKTEINKKLDNAIVDIETLMEKI